MKILIAYDGSPFADAAIDDLQRAGLPPSAEAIVLSVADVWLPPAGTDEDDVVYAGLDQRVHARVLELRADAKSMFAEAGRQAGQAAGKVRSIFPGWKVQSEAVADSPAWGIIKRAGEWPADLIVVGSHGMSMTQRLFLGSVSQRVMTDASCSVRVARARTAAKNVPIRLIIGFDGSRDAEAAVREVASRSWPEDSEFRLITAIDHSMRHEIVARILKLEPPLGSEVEGDYETWLSKIAESTTEQLVATRLKATCSVTVGEPKRVLLEAAEQWPADCIFLGATGSHGLRRILVGSVTSAVTAHSRCTVEIVRAGSASSRQ